MFLSVKKAFAFEFQIACKYLFSTLRIKIMSIRKIKVFDLLSVEPSEFENKIF